MEPNPPLNRKKKDSIKKETGCEETKTPNFNTKMNEEDIEEAKDNMSNIGSSVVVFNHQIQK